MLLDRLAAFSSSPGGLDKSLRILQYTLGLLAAIAPSGPASKAHTPISSARVTMRIFGTIQMLALILKRLNSRNERAALASDLSLLAYYAAELGYWLAVNKILSSSSAGPFGRLSCAAWALWIGIELKEKKPRSAALGALLCDLLLAVHWMLPKPLLSPALESSTGLVGGLLSAIPLWEATSKQD